MKKYLFFICGLAFSFVSFAQDKTSGTVTYKETQHLNLQISGMGSQMMDSLPKEFSLSKILYFTPEATSYQKSKEVQDDHDMDGPGGFRFRMPVPNDIFYYDLKDNKCTEQREFMTRIFLIENQHKKEEWKMTSNQKMIMGFPCMEAVSTDTAEKVTAWFTPVIPVSSGPSGYGGLPGLILSVEIDQGDRVITASKIEYGEVNKDLMVKPSKGKKVTKEEYKTIVDEKLKEMGVERGHGPGKQIMIRINH